MKTILLPILLIVLISCQNKESMLKDSSKAKSVNFLEASDNAAEEPPMASERKLIKNGQLVFETSNVTDTKKKLDKISNDFHAYPSSQSQSNLDSRLQHDLVVRVPSNRFDEFIGEVEKLAIKVESKNITTEDVTEQFIDTEARLKTKKELEIRFREILKQAKTVEEILSIESQLSNVRTEIESAEGKLNYLKSQIAMSTLTITYYELIGTDFGFASKFVYSLGEGWDNLLQFFIGLVSIWPFVLAIAGGVFWFWRRKRLKTKKP
jgi:Domain of unknown function (DUF4349)